MNYSLRSTLLISLLIGWHSSLTAAQWYNEQFVSHFIAEVKIDDQGPINRLAVTCDQNNRDSLYLRLALNRPPHNRRESYTIESRIDIGQQKFMVDFVYDNQKYPYLRSASQLNSQLIAALKRGYRLTLQWQEANATTTLKTNLNRSYRAIRAIEQKCSTEQITNN